MVTLVPIWISPESGDSVTPLELTRTWDTIPQLGTTGPGESTPHLGFDWTCDSFPTWHQWDMVTLFPTWASPGHDNFAPHFGLNWS